MLSQLVNVNTKSFGSAPLSICCTSQTRRSLISLKAFLLAILSTAAVASGRTNFSMGILSQQP